MASVTFGELTARILTDTNRGGSDLEDPNTGLPLYPAAIQRAILSAIYLVEPDWYWLFEAMVPLTVPQGDNSVALPANFNKLIRAQAVYNENFYGPRQRFLNVTFNELLSFFTNASQTGIPVNYALDLTNLYIYPYVPEDTVFNLYYYYKDTNYPVVDGQLGNTGTSIWFGTDTVDMVRYKAMEMFYRDTLQAPDMAQAYMSAYMEQVANLARKNATRQSYNLLSF